MAIKLSLDQEALLMSVARKFGDKRRQHFFNSVANRLRHLRYITDTTVERAIDESIETSRTKCRGGKKYAGRSRRVQQTERKP
jgi:hypothetical protein